VTRIAGHPGPEGAFTKKYRRNLAGDAPFFVSSCTTRHRFVFSPIPHRAESSGAGAQIDHFGFDADFASSSAASSARVHHRA